MPPPLPRAWKILNWRDSCNLDIILGLFVVGGQKTYMKFYYYLIFMILAVYYLSLSIVVLAIKIHLKIYPSAKDRIQNRISIKYVLEPSYLQD